MHRRSSPGQGTRTTMRMIGPVSLLCMGPPTFALVRRIQPAIRHRGHLHGDEGRLRQTDALNAVEAGSVNVLTAETEIILGDYGHTDTVPR